MEKLEDFFEKYSQGLVTKEEVIKKSYNSKCDVWSLGVVMHELLFGCIPNINSNGFVVFNEKMGSLISEDCYTLLTSMLRVDPNMRYDWTDVFKSPCLNVSVLNYQLSALTTTNFN